MKNRRNIIIAFLLCATLIVSVGYATVVDILDVDGTFEYFSEHHSLDADINFGEAKAYNSGSDNSNDIAEIVASDTDKAIFKVKSLDAGNKVAYFRFRVDNVGTESAHIFLRNSTSYGTTTTQEGDADPVVESLTALPLTVYYTWDSMAHDLTNLNDQDFFNAYSTWATAKTETPGDHSHEVPSDSNMYLYIAVTWNDSTIPENLVDLTANFAFEFGVQTEAIGEHVDE